MLKVSVGLLRDFLILLASLFLLITIGAAAKALAAPATSSTSTKQSAQNGTSGDLALGIMLGEPTGPTLKYWSTSSTALQFGVAYSWDSYLALLADHLWHFRGAFGTGATSSLFVPYVGIGGVVQVNTGGPYYERYYNGRWWVTRDDERRSVSFGARVPLGLEFLPRKAPFGLFAELAPGVGLLPGAFGFIQAGIGIRFYL